MKKNLNEFVTCGQMKILERRADESGLSYYRMMENAGTGAGVMIMDKAASYVANPKKIYVFCGKGNNGGDGFVAARILHDKGYDVTVVLVDGEPKTQDSLTNLGLVRVRDIKIVDMSEDGGALIKLEDNPDIIVDAIYGTGFHGELKGNGLKATIYINSYVEEKKTNGMHSMVVALDIPSGLGGDMVDEAEADINSVKADMTITFHAKKPIHLQEFAQAFCGEVKVLDIGIDEEKLWAVEA